MRSKMSARRTAFLLIGLPLLGATAAIGIGEIVARAFWVEPFQAPKPKREAPSNLPVIKKGVLALATSDLEGIFNGAYFHNNSAGFRGPEFARWPDPSVFRIAVIGDSVTMGSGVANHESYPARLAALLRDEIAGQRFEVLNFGLSGLNTAFIYERADRLARQFHPNLIVYGVTLNDIEGRHYVKQGRNNARGEQRRRYAQFAQSPSYLMRVLWPRWQSVQDLIVPAPGTYLAELRHNYSENPPAWQDFNNALRAIAELGDEIEAPLVVFIHTTLAYLNRFHPFRPMYDKIAYAAEAMNVPVIRSFDAHLGEASESLWVSKMDPHPNARGHEILARALFRGLVDLPDGYFPAPASSR